ncbi:hypothetical protein S7335_3183 [Synechococcus sp. PCC 7335]|nr:hypothetical protein S7335_3183 [Synechococcus sp. PCC 7335]
MEETSDEAVPKLSDINSETRRISIRLYMLLELIKSSSRPPEACSEALLPSIYHEFSLTAHPLNALF